VTDDRQTDHAMEKCVAIGGIVCRARAILHKVKKLLFFTLINTTTVKLQN